MPPLQVHLHFRRRIVSTDYNEKNTAVIGHAWPYIGSLG
jgi:hypothetical protein